MKLIDKDRLNKEWIGLIPFGITEVLVENLKWITDHQPVIEAIPIEYLFKELKQCKASTVVEVGAIIDKWVKENGD